MLIAIDFDGTFDRDPETWSQVIKLLQAGGHEVVCVTMRYPTETLPLPIPCEVVYTERGAKMNHMVNLGRKPHIWIDDSPHWILNDSF